MSTSAAVLETRGLTFGFGGNVVTDRVSLAVRDGEFLSLIGPNGAGKTTYFNLLCGLYQPTAGTILFRGRDITSMDTARRARAGLARSFQLSSLFVHLPVWENVRLAAQAQSRSRYSLLRPFTTYREFLERADAALALVGLGACRALPAGSLSHGDKRKLELAMVIAMNPQILLLDEPTSGVSAEDVSTMVDLIERIRRTEGKTIMMVEHKMGVVRRLSDRVAVLHRGHLIALDTPDRVAADSTVQSAYLGVDVDLPA